MVLQFLHLILDGDGFVSETAARKSDLSRIGAFFLLFIQCEIPLSLVSFAILFRGMVRVILLCQHVHLYALLLGPPNFEFRFTS